MRAAHVTQLGDPDEAVSIVDVEQPEPGPGEVRLRVEAYVLNRLDVFRDVVGKVVMQLGE